MTPNLIPAANRAAEGGGSYNLAEGGASHRCGSGTSCRLAEGGSL
jgi:hypothetical protein